MNLTGLANFMASSSSCTRYCYSKYRNWTLDDTVLYWPLYGQKLNIHFMGCFITESRILNYIH